MRRRDLIGGILVSTAIPALAQEAKKVYRIAVVAPAGPVSEISETASNPHSAFLTGLRHLGYIEGKNLEVERYSAEGHPDAYSELVRKVVQRKPDAVLIYTGSLAREFKAQTTTIPIIALVIDPIALGLVSSVARPAGNVTGVYAALEIWGKRLGVLKEAIPKLSRVGLLVAPTLVAEHGAAMLKATAGNQGVSIVGSPMDTPVTDMSYRRAFQVMAQDGAEAVYVGDQAENFVNPKLIVELADQYRLPAIYPMREAVEIGGFMSYAIDYRETFRHAADVADQIFHGTQPGDIPFYQATKFDLAINLNTARALSIEISPNLLAQADEVIE